MNIQKEKLIKIKAYISNYFDEHHNGNHGNFTKINIFTSNKKELIKFEIGYRSKSVIFTFCFYDDDYISVFFEGSRIQDLLIKHISGGEVKFVRDFCKVIQTKAYEMLSKN